MIGFDFERSVAVLGFGFKLTGFLVFLDATGFEAARFLGFEAVGFLGILLLFLGMLFRTTEGVLFGGSALSPHAQTRKKRDKKKIIFLIMPLCFCMVS
ncbi:hypothetical protein ACFL03_05190 [Thermodesulfobacteriota bacterium]